MASGGVVAAGNRDTAAVAAEILNDGGNAFDALIAALFAASVTEPVLSSLGGGGFMLAAPAAAKPVLVDFFTNTPGRASRPDGSALDFRAIHADFGATTQEFHIGRASVAVPGMVAGLFDIHDNLGSLPMRRLVEPAVRLAKAGVALDSLQAEILKVVTSIVLSSAETRALYAAPDDETRVKGTGDMLTIPDHADFIEALAGEGPRLFYEGEIAAAIADSALDGGLLTRDDFKTYQVRHRQPLTFPFLDREIITNPVPSAGGALIGFSLMLLERALKSGVPDPMGADWPLMMADIMATTNDARHATGFATDPAGGIDVLLKGETLDHYFAALQGRAMKVGGTTHISIADGAGNMVSATVSNGEGNGEIVRGTGMHLNNMLGEEDLNPRGFFNWTPGTRQSSMMAPTLMRDPSGALTALGSGGSNRIRSALFQVIARLSLFSDDLEQAISAPRIHYERGSLHMEDGWSGDVIGALVQAHADHKIWPGQSFFFGGVHAVVAGKRGLTGMADPRRAGVVEQV